MNRFTFACEVGCGAELEIIKAGLGVELQRAKAEMLGNEVKEGNICSFHFFAPLGNDVAMVGHNFEWADPVGTADTVFLRASELRHNGDKALAVTTMKAFMQALNEQVAKNAGGTCGAMQETRVSMEVPT